MFKRDHLMNNCEVCGLDTTHVCASSLGAISHALCDECLSLGRQPWTTLIGGLYGVRKDTCADWVKPIIKATCDFYGKTEDDLWAEVEKLEKDYEEYCRK